MTRKHELLMTKVSWLSRVQETRCKTTFHENHMLDNYSYFSPFPPTTWNGKITLSNIQDLSKNTYTNLCLSSHVNYTEQESLLTEHWTEIEQKLPNVRMANAEFRENTWSLVCLLSNWMQVKGVPKLRRRNAKCETPKMRNSGAKRPIFNLI